MTINLMMPVTHEMKPKITVVGIGGAGGNAVNNMITSHLEGVEFVACNTDAQALGHCLTERRIQLGHTITHGLGAGARPEVGRAAAEESLDEILDQLQGSNMVFITAGMGGGTGTGAAPVIARAVRDQGILTVGVVTKPFHFEGAHRMRLAEAGLIELQEYVDTLIVIPNQNLFRLANERTTFGEAFQMADQVLHMGVRGVTDLMVMPGLINLDFADIRTVMSEMGKAMMGTGEATGERRAIEAAEAAISNPLLDEVSMRGARGVLINITGGSDIALFEVDAAANRIREEVDADANIIFGSTFDDSLDGGMRVSVVATGIEAPEQRQQTQQAAEPARDNVAQQAGWFPQEVHKPQPYPAVGRSAKAAPGKVPSPAASLHAAQEGRQPGLSEPPARDGYAPPPSEPAPYGREGRQPAHGGGGQGYPRHEERSRSIFDKMRGLAFRQPSHSGEGGEREQEDEGSGEPVRQQRSPSAESDAAAQQPRQRSSSQDEIGDVPAFLRRERVEG